MSVWKICLTILILKCCCKRSRTAQRPCTPIFNLLAGLMFMITIAGWMFGISTGAETLRLLAVAFVVFIIPHIAEWLIVRIAVINYGLRDFIKS